MKKVTIILALIMVLSVFTSGSSAAVDPIKLQINGSYVMSDVDPFIENDRTLVPIRIISETLGYKVDWEPTEQKVIIYDKGQENTDNSIMLIIGDSTIYIGVSEELKIDVAPKIVDDRTFVPIRAIAEIFGYDVDWDNDTRTVIITDPNKDLRSHIYPIKEKLGEVKQLTISRTGITPGSSGSDTDQFIFDNAEIEILDSIHGELLKSLRDNNLLEAGETTQEQFISSSKLR